MIGQFDFSQHSILAALMNPVPLLCYRSQPATSPVTSLLQRRAGCTPPSPCVTLPPDCFMSPQRRYVSSTTFLPSLPPLPLSFPPSSPFFPPSQDPLLLLSLPPYLLLSSPSLLSLFPSFSPLPLYLFFLLPSWEPATSYRPPSRDCTPGTGWQGL